MWPWIVGGIAIGTTVALWEKFSKKKYSPPPPGPGGYKAPPAPPNIPPSWVYQGPPIPPSTPTAVVKQITLKPGDMFETEAKGSTIYFNLPTGAKWLLNQGAMVPTSIGGNLNGGMNADNKPAVLDSIDGAGTILFNWIDSSGKQQRTLYDLNTSQVKA